MKMLARLIPIFVICLLLAACSGQGVKPDGAADGVDRNAPAAEVNAQIGIEYLRRGDLEQADKKLRRALAQNPVHQPAHLAFAMLQERLAQNVEAERHYRQAIALKPDDSAAYNNFGAFLCRQGRTKEAESAFMKALENPLYRTPELALNNAGLCALQEGNAKKAEAFFRRALDFSPRYGAPMLELADLMHGQGRHGQARIWLKSHADTNLETPRSLWLCVRIERALGHTDAAQRCSLRLRGLFSDAPETKQLRELEGRDG